MGDMDKRNVFYSTSKASKFMLLSVLFIAAGIVIIIVSAGITIGLPVIGIGCIMIGISAFAKEVKFIIDKNNGRYTILNAVLVDFKKDIRISSNSTYTVYKKVYEFMENGEIKRFISDKGSQKIMLGEEILLYRNEFTGEIREGVKFGEEIFLLLGFAGLGILFIYLSVKFGGN